MNKIRVLFLCSGNSVRGLMAYAFMRKYGGEEFHVNSGGLEPRGVDIYTKRVLAEKDIDISHYKSEDVRKYLGEEFYTYLISLCADAECQITTFPGATYRLSWPFEDPTKVNGNDEEAKLNKFREVRDQIEEKIKVWVEEVRGRFHLLEKEQAASSQ